MTAGLTNGVELTDDPRTPSTERALLTVTVMDTATIYEGPEAVYRYDIPGSGIVDGWALSAALDQARKVMGPQWPNVRVAVVTDPSGTAVSDEAALILRRQFSLTDAIVEAADVVSPHRPAGRGSGDQYPVTTAFQPLGVGAAEPVSRERVGERRGKQGRHALKRKSLHSFEPFDYLDPFHGVIAVVVVIVIGVCWWTLRGSDGEKAASDAKAMAAGGTTSEAPELTETLWGATALPERGKDNGDRQAKETQVKKEAEENKEDKKAGQDSATDSKEIPAQDTAVGQVRLRLPEGFSVTENEGVFTATGEDPNLRVLVATDPMFNVPREALYAQLRDDVESDESLDKAFERDGRFLYTENPGDGSLVEWSTWVEGDQQVSVGCHSRNDPTTVQKAACRMAVETARLEQAETPKEG